jgi:hypothetical protein
MPPLFDPESRGVASDVPREAKGFDPSSNMMRLLITRCASLALSVVKFVSSHT